MNDEDKIVFSASLAGTNTSARWLSVDREGCAKLALEVPAGDLGQVLRLAVLGGQTLKVTVEIDA